MPVRSPPIALATMKRDGRQRRVDHAAPAAELLEHEVPVEDGTGPAPSSSAAGSPRASAASAGTELVPGVVDDPLALDGGEPARGR